MKQKDLPEDWIFYAQPFCRLSVWRCAGCPCKWSCSSKSPAARKASSVPAVCPRYSCRLMLLRQHPHHCCYLSEDHEHSRPNQRKIVVSTVSAKCHYILKISKFTFSQVQFSAFCLQNNRWASRFCFVNRSIVKNQHGCWGQINQ